MIIISQFESDKYKLQYLKLRKLKGNNTLFGNVIPDEIEAYIEIVANQQGIKLNGTDFRLLNKLVYLSGNNTFGITLTDQELAIRMSDETPRSISARLSKLESLGIITRKITYQHINGHPLKTREIRFNPEWLQPPDIAILNEVNDLYKERYQKYEQEVPFEPIETTTEETTEKTQEFSSDRSFRIPIKTYANLSNGEKFEL